MDEKTEHENTYESTPKPEKRRTWTAGKIIALALCCALIGGLFGAGGAVLVNSLGKKAGGETAVFQGTRELATVDTIVVDTSRQMTVPEVYAANVNSTVGITTSITTNYWGFQTTSAASGSGFVITADGYILTNYHVIENSNSVSVSTYDGTKYDAQVVGFDESNDVAVLKIEASGLTPVVLGDSDNMSVGEGVVAIGNPLGELTFSATEGIVSALNREVTISGTGKMGLIQTDCAINSGNSGGALFNMHGEVVGITNAKYSSNSSSASIDNIGFAIPINSVSSIVKSIIENGYYAKPYIGISVSDVSSEAASYGLPQGAAVKSVAENSPAEKAGLQENDIITKVGETEITDRYDLVELVKACSKGDVLNLTVYRQGETIELSVTVDEKIASATEATQQETEQETEQDGQTFPWGFSGFNFG